MFFLLSLQRLDNIFFVLQTNFKSLCQNLCIYKIKRVIELQLLLLTEVRNFPSCWIYLMLIFLKSNKNLIALKPKFQVKFDFAEANPIGSIIFQLKPFAHPPFFFSPEKVSFFESMYKNLLKVDFSRIRLDEISNRRNVGEMSLSLIDGKWL